MISHGTLPCSLQVVTGVCPASDESCPHPTNIFQLRSILLLSSLVQSSKWSLCFEVHDKALYAFQDSHMRTVCKSLTKIHQTNNKTPWPESASELYRPNDRRLSAKLVTTFADRGSHVVSVTDPCGRILGFLDRSRYFFFKVAPQLYSRG
jgi:hypothetical protein